MSPDFAKRIGQAFTKTLTDEALWRTGAKQGVWLLVPVVGYVALLGWQRRAFERARVGDLTPPPTGLGENLSAGWAVLVAILLLYFVPVVAVALLIGLPFELMHVRIGKIFPEEIVQFPVVAFIIAAYVEVLRRVLVSGERTAILRPLVSFRALRRAPKAFALTALAMAGAYIIAAVGLNACLVGAIVSAPIGHVVAARLIVVWQSELELSSASKPL